MNLKAIGFVRNEFDRRAPGSTDWFLDSVSEIVVDESLTEGLDKLDGFSHIIVLYWMHRAAGDDVPLKSRPKSVSNVPETGVFASRSPNRPNPIGQTIVKLLGRRGSVLDVKGLDALNGTPVIDIKPYMPDYDSPDGAVMPEWAKRLYPWI